MSSDLQGGDGIVGHSGSHTGPPLAGLRRHWIVAFLVGELVGFVPPAVVGATLAELQLLTRS